MKGFNNTLSNNKDTIHLPTKAGNEDGGSITHEELFYVMDTPSRYIAILGKEWQTRMKAIPSIVHHVLKFPALDDIFVIELKEEQLGSNYDCFTLAENRGIINVDFSKAEAAEPVRFQSRLKSTSAQKRSQKLLILVLVPMHHLMKILYNFADY